MFMVDAATSAAVRDAWINEGEAAAIALLRSHFPGLADNANTAMCARTIASWTPIPEQPVKPKRRKAARNSTLTKAAG